WNMPQVPQAGSFKSTRARPAGCWAGRLVLATGAPAAARWRLGALRALLDVELDDLPLSKRAVASRLDRAEMHEDIFAGLRGDEAIALLGVEPLHGSNRHVPVPPSTVLEVSTNAGPTLAPVARGQARPAVARQNVHL